MPLLVVRTAEPAPATPWWAANCGRSSKPRALGSVIARVSRLALYSEATKVF